MKRGATPFSANAFRVHVRKPVRYSPRLFINRVNDCPLEDDDSQFHLPEFAQRASRQRPILGSRSGSEALKHCRKGLGSVADQHFVTDGGFAEGTAKLFVEKERVIPEASGAARRVEDAAFD